MLLLQRMSLSFPNGRSVENKGAAAARQLGVWDELFKRASRGRQPRGRRAPPSGRVYADNAATTAVSGEALDQMAAAMTARFANPSTNYLEGREARALLDQSRHVFAMAIGAALDGDVCFTSCGTESNNIVIRGIMEGQRRRSPARNSLVISAVEHSSVRKTAEASGYKVYTAEVDTLGIVKVPEFERLLREHREEIGLVSVIMCQNETGAVQPIRKLVEVARDVLGGSDLVPFHTDATQALGKVRVDVGQLGVDALTASSHKFHGPRGVGLLYSHTGLLDGAVTTMTGGGQEDGVRSGTENVPAIWGAAVALSHQVADVDANYVRVDAMRNYLLEGIAKKIPGVVLNSEPHACMPYIVNFSLPNKVHAHDVTERMDAMGVCVNSGSACSRGRIPSQTLIRMGRSEDLAHSAIRISLSHTNTMDECRTIVSVLAAAYREQLGPR